MTDENEKFGVFVRRKRQRKGVGLRQMAKMIDVNPTDPSKIERDEFARPAEDKVKAIAKILDCDWTNCWLERGGWRWTSRTLSRGVRSNWQGFSVLQAVFQPQTSVLRRHAEEVKSELPSLKTPNLSKRELNRNDLFFGSV